MNTPIDMAKFAAQVCGIKPIEPSNKQTPVVIGGMYQYQFTSAGDLVIDCYFDYTKETPDTRDEPGDRESIDLCYAMVNGVDIVEVLSDDTVALIEEEALASMEMDKWDDEYDRGEELAMDRATDWSAA